MHHKAQYTRLGISIFLGYLLIPPLAVMAVVAFAGGQSDRAMADLIEKELWSWTRPAGHTKLPMDFKPVSVADISGTWSVSRGHDGSGLVLRKRSGNIYDVTFSSHGCEASWTLFRTARLDSKAGVLTLNRPVREYLPSTYDLLYVVNLGGKLRLVPASNLEEFPKRNDGEFFRRFYTYTKKRRAYEPHARYACLQAGAAGRLIL